MEIELSRGRMRDWRPSDAESLLKHANNLNVSRNLRDAFPYPYTADDATRWLQHNVGREPITNFAIEIGGEAAGSVSLRLQSDIYGRVAEIGYWIAEPHWGRGIASEAARAMTGYGFARFPLDRIEAEVFERNAASMRVLEKAGYRLEGTLRQRITKAGETMDATIYAILRSEWADSR
jgi:ribosomal-protein-alanine N-acetyltransferase